MSRAAPAENLLQAHERAKIFLVIGIPIMAAYGIAALRSGSWALLALIVVNVVIICASYVALRRGHHRTWMVRPGMATYAALVLYLVAHSGEEHSHALWFFAFPVVSVMLLPPREGVVWSGLSIATATAMMLLGGPETGTSAYSAAFAARFAITAILITGGMFWSEVALRVINPAVASDSETKNDGILDHLPGPAPVAAPQTGSSGRVATNAFEKPASVVPRSCRDLIGDFPYNA